MMRDFKFRAWHQADKMMRPVGVLDFDRNVVVAAHPNDYAYSLSAVILLQYTGLKDMNDKDIYEGDILRYSQRAFRKRTTYVDGYSQVVYKRNAFILEPSLMRWNDSALGLMPREMVVIGNIYENPELLKRVEK